MWYTIYMTRYDYTKEQVELALKDAKTIKEFLVNLGMKINNGNYRQAQRITAEFGLELPKFDYSNATHHLIVKNTIPDSEFFSEGVLRTGPSLKKRLIKDHGLEDKCYGEGCSVTNTWLGKKITIQVDHIDGNKFNNKVDNLRLLCPNCHAQTDTYGNNLSSVTVRYNYCSCGVRISRTSLKCNKCENAQRLNRGSSTYPPIEELIEMIRNSSFLAVGKELGVSDNAVRKYLQRRGVDTKTIK